MKRIFLVLMAVIVVLALVSCGNSYEYNADVAAYVELTRDDVESVSTEFFTVEAEARGAFCVYKYTLTDVSNLDSSEISSMKEAGKATLDSMDMDGVVADMKKECPALEGLIYEYYDADGVLLYSFEYLA